MIKNILPFFLFSSCFCSSQLYFLDDNVTEQESVEAVQQSQEKPEKPRSYEPVSAKDFNSKRSTLLLNQRTWISLGIGQGSFSFGKNTDFDKSSEVTPQVPLAITPAESTDKEKMISFSFLTRDKNFAYGLNVDYRKDLQNTLTTVTWGPSGGETTLNGVALESDFFPIHLSARYYLTDGWRLQPFVGLGLGATYQRNKLSFTDNSYKKAYWIFWSYILEGGATVCLTESFSLDLLMQNHSVRYRAPEFVENTSTLKIKSATSNISMKILLNMYF